MKHHKASPLLTLFMMMLLSPLTTIAGELLSGDEIEALFSNRTFEGIHLKNGWTFKNYAGSDGGCNVLFLSGKKRDQTRLYRWYVKDNMHCCDTGRRKICGTISDEGNGVYHKHRNGKRHIQTFMNFIEGRQL